MVRSVVWSGCRGVEVMSGMVGLGSVGWSQDERGGVGVFRGG